MQSRQRSIPNPPGALLFFLSAVAFAAVCALQAAPDARNEGPPNPPEPTDTVLPETELEKIPAEFTEVFGGSPGEIRYRVRNVRLNGGGRVARVTDNPKIQVSMDILHDCRQCGNAINQVIVGLAGEERAQLSVWNGKQRSGGELRTVNPGSRVACLAEDNRGPAEWVTVRFTIRVPKRAGVYYLRTRYAQDYRGNLYTEAARASGIEQPIYQDVLGWWKVDRPQGPDSTANIGAIIVKVPGDR
ncbi:MAG: hypothetical protein NXI24_13845 [bacterium]|nr:hypothetical protein [bacterium]